MSLNGDEPPADPTASPPAKEGPSRRLAVLLIIAVVALVLIIVDLTEGDNETQTSTGQTVTETAETTAETSRTYPTFSRAPYTTPTPRRTPTPTYSVTFMIGLLGRPCSPVGATYPPPTAESTTANEVTLGIYCAPTGWASIDVSQGSCGLQSPIVNVTAAGVPLTCVGGRLFADGETVPVLFAATYTVGRGTGQVAPGTYEVFNVTNCYWERLDDAGNILDNNFINGAPRAEFTIQESDFAINIEGCGGWKLVP